MGEVIPLLSQRDKPPQMIQKVISGGQTGADRAGLDWATFPRPTARRLVRKMHLCSSRITGRRHTQTKEQLLPLGVAPDAQ